MISSIMKLQAALSGMLNPKQQTISFHCPQALFLLLNMSSSLGLSTQLDKPVAQKALKRLHQNNVGVIHVLAFLLLSFLEGSFGIPCVRPPPEPKDFAAFPISDTQALLAWDKLIGEEYSYQFTYGLAAAIRYKSLQGLQGYGPFEMVLLSELTPATEYHAEVTTLCALNSNLRSNPAKVNFKTLDRGNWAVLNTLDTENLIRTFQERVVIL